MKFQIMKTLIIICLLLSITSNINLESLAATPSLVLAHDKGFGVQHETQSDDAAIIHATSTNTHRSTSIDAMTTFFLPLIFHDRKVPDLRSPFSLQIAALHQILPNAKLKENASYANSSIDPDLLSLDEGTYASLASALRDSGADWARVRVEWEHIEFTAPTPGQPPDYYWQYYDEALTSVAGAGVQIIATLSDSPSWAASVPCAPIYPDRLDDFSRFLIDLVDRYKGTPFYIRHWELVNEPDSNRYTSGHLSGHGCWAYDADQYAQMLAVANQAIKEADPSATILMGGIAYDWFEEYGGPFYRYFPDEVMENGGGGYIDALNLHFYTDFSHEWDRWNPKSVDRRYGWIPAPTCGIVDDGVGTPYDVEGFDIGAKTSHFRNRMNVCYGVSKPVWVTEVGEHGFPEDQESLNHQASYVIKVYARALAAGVQNVTWYSLGQPPYDRQGQSLLYSDFTPKPAFFAYQTLTSELNGYYEYSHDRNICSWGSSGVTCLVEAYIFKNDANAEKTIAWGSRSLIFNSSKLSIVDRNGVEITILDGDKRDSDGKINGKIKLKLSDEPVFIETW